MATNGREIVQRFDKLDREASTHKDRWEKMAPFIAPSRVGITGRYADGEKLNRNVYDSTMLMAAELLAHFIAGYTINPGQQWQSYEMADSKVAKDDQAREWLEECRDINLKNAANSSFYAEGSESIIDWSGFGTGFTLIEEAAQAPNLVKRGFRGFACTAEKTGRFLIQDGVNGRVDTAFRQFSLTARVIKARWPNEKLPENITKSLESNEIDKPFKIIHGIYPRAMGDRGYGSKGMPWASCWTDYESKEVIYESGYRVFPVAVPRYSKTPGEVFGRGRGDIAFSDSWTLNTAKRMALEDWALKIRPPILHGSDSVIGTLRLMPGAPTAINTHGKPITDQIMPFQTGSHPEVTQINEENLRKSIREIFYVEHILALLEVHKSEMTVFEYARKLELLFKLLATVYGRLEWEWLIPISDIMFDLQLYAGAFPPPPPIIQQTNGLINVKFLNPLAKAQRSGEAESFMMWVNDMAPLAQAHPEVLDWIDLDNAIPLLGEARGVLARYIRSPKQVQTMRAAKQVQESQDLQLEQMSQMAEAAGKAAPALQILQGGKKPS